MLTTPITEPTPVSSYLQTARTTKGLVTLSLRGDRYVIQGPSGEHTLNVLSTSAKRLSAHFDGFVEANGGRADAGVSAAA